MSVLVLDWDETVTVRDTTSLIAHIAETNSVKGIPFLYFTKSYLNSYRRFQERFKKEGDIDTKNKELEFQKQLRTVELESLALLEKSQFFEGVNMLKFVEAGPSVELQPGTVEFLKRFDGPIYILSINWCKSMIEACLRSHSLDHLMVMANDLEVKQGVTTGRFLSDFDIRTGSDKVIYLKQILSSFPDHKIIYIGDSDGDVSPILEADLSILMKNGRGEQQLRKIIGAIQELDINTCSLRNLSGIYQGSWFQITKALTE